MPHPDAKGKPPARRAGHRPCMSKRHREPVPRPASGTAAGARQPAPGGVPAPLRGRAHSAVVEVR